MIRCDFHMHTNFSGDSKAIPGHMIHSAVEKGLQTICFTDHNDPAFPYTPNETPGMFDLDTKRYMNTMSELADLYKDKIHILRGVELGLQTHIYKEATEYINSHPFDFVICSSHLCQGVDPFYKEFWEGRSTKTCLLSYFEEIRQNVTHYSDFDVYGHLDYIVRYAPSKNADFAFSDYSDIFEDILKKLIHNGKGIEVNSAGYRQGLHAPNPCKEILKLYRSLGGEIITVGSDAHKPEDIASSFDQIETLLWDCGFRYYTMFQNRKPKFISLNK